MNPLATVEKWLAIVGVVLIVAVGGIFYGRHLEREHAEVAVAQANAKVEVLQTQLLRKSEETAGALIKIDQTHAHDYAAALAGVKPVIVRLPANPVPMAGGTPGGLAANAGEPEHVPLPVERDISTALVMLADRCQRDLGRDDALGWQRWWNEQKRLAGKTISPPSPR